MKKFIFFILAIALVFSNYSEPPIAQVLEHNKNLSQSLFSFSLSSTLKESPLNLDSLANGNIQLLSIFPSVEDRIPSSMETFIFWTATFSFSETEPDFCGVKFDHQTIAYSLNFTFRNDSKFVSGSAGSVAGLPSHISIPFLEEELNQSQDDKLIVSLKWTNNIVYKNCNMIGSGNNRHCACEYISLIPLSGTDSIIYYVDGSPVIYFLHKPILKEQWYKNNHFDSLIFSNRKFYDVKIKKNGDLLVPFHLYTFNISEDNFGIQSINKFHNNFI